MLIGYRRCGDSRGGHDRYRSGLNHDRRGRGRGVGGGLATMAFRTVVDAVSVHKGYASEHERYAKSQCGGFKSVFHNHYSLGWFGLAERCLAERGSVTEDTVTMRRERLSTR